MIVPPSLLSSTAPTLPPVTLSAGWRFPSAHPLAPYLLRLLTFPLSPTERVAKPRTRAALPRSGDEVWWRIHEDGSVEVPRHALPLEEMPLALLGVVDLRPAPDGYETQAWTFGANLRPSQEGPSRALLNARDGLLVLPCNSGKTVIALHALAQRQAPFLIVVPTRTLLDQWVAQIRTFLGVERDHQTLSVWSGEERGVWPATPIVVTTIHSLATSTRLPDLTRYRTVVFDECHHLAADVFSQACWRVVGDRWGLTATPVRADGREDLLMLHLGPRLAWEEDPRVDPPVASPLLVAYLPMTCEARNALQDVLLAEGRSILLVHRTLALLRRESVLRRSGLVVGGMTAKARTEALAQREIYAIESLLAEGFDKADLNTLLLLRVPSHPSALTQIAGRLLRNRTPFPSLLLLAPDQERRTGTKALRLWAEEQGFSYLENPHALFRTLSSLRTVSLPRHDP